MNTTNTTQFASPDEYIRALNQKFLECVEAYYEAVFAGGFTAGGFNPNSLEVTIPHDKMTQAASDIFAFREEERKRRKLVDDMPMPSSE
jgi:hypothetical protein